MKSFAGLLTMVLLLIFVMSANASPNYAFRELPEAGPIGDPGSISAMTSFSSMGWCVDAAGSLTPRIDIAFSIEPADLFDPAIRFCLIRDLLPLQVSVWASVDQISLVSTLLLGPVHVNYGGAWTWSLSGRRRWGYVQYAINQRLTLLLGIDNAGGRLGQILGLRIQPGRTRLWGASILLRGEDLRITIGGVL